MLGVKYRGLDELRCLSVALALSQGKRSTTRLKQGDETRLKYDVKMRRKETHREGFREIGAAIDQQLEHVHETFISSSMSWCPSVLSIVSRKFLMKCAEMKKVIARSGSQNLRCLVHISVRLDQKHERRHVVVISGNEHGCNTILRGKGRG